MTRIAIDPNVRVRGNLTYSGYEDIEGELPLDGCVEVYEPESDLVGIGRIVDQDDEAELVYIEVEWASLRPRVVQPALVPGGILVTATPSFGGSLVEMHAPLGTLVTHGRQSLTA